MSMSRAETERKLRQHDDDLRSIYDLLGSIQATQVLHGNRLDELAEKLTAHDARFDAHDARFDAHDARFDAHDARFDRLEGKVDRLEGKVDSILDLLRDRGDQR